MSNPLVASKTPFAVEVESGKNYSWCACGLSKTQPFCDGSHKDTDIKPVNFKPETSETVYLCGCKQTANQPFCDGTHSTL